MLDIEQVMQELSDFSQLQDALDDEVLCNVGRQLQAAQAYRKLVLSRYGIAQAFAPAEDE